MCSSEPSSIASFSSASQTIHPPELSKSLEVESGLLTKLPLIPDETLQEFLNKLHIHWEQKRCSVMIDAQERMTKIVSFISQIPAKESCFFLIISTFVELPLWDKVLTLLAPSLSGGVYLGSENIDSGMRIVELSNMGSMLSQVIVTSAEILAENLGIFASGSWGGIVIDECQSSCVYERLETFNVLTCDWMLLLVNKQLKRDKFIEKLLSVLDYRNDQTLDKCSVPASFSRSDSLSKRLTKYIIKGCGPVSRFFEYWVPVGISNIQVEEYCGNLFFNNSSLCSTSKVDGIGSLHRILTDARKCCDHPYHVDKFLQASLMREAGEINYLEVGINSCGKLKLLVKMLSEFKVRALKVLVVFQTNSGNTGSILEDVVQLKFGDDAYERCDGIFLPSKRQAVLQKFNTQEKTFILLLDTQSCCSSIKLSSVDCVILYGSDWNPMNDIKNLQKLVIDSKSDRIKLFRLFSAFTVEERVLMFARDGNNLEMKLTKLRSIAFHMLLMWGSSVLFEKLDKFHSTRFQDSSYGDCMFPNLQPEDVFQEIQAILDLNGKVPENSSLINKVDKQDIYISHFPLPGEKEILSVDDELPHVFWDKLFKGKQPRWRYTSPISNEKKRNRVQWAQSDPEFNGDQGLKKQKKLVGTDNNLSFADDKTLKIKDQDTSELVTCESFPKQSIPTLSDVITGAPKLTTECSDKLRNIRELQESLHILLKLEIAKLCEILKFPENVMVMVERFLDYVMSNHVVTREPASLLEAFQLSLCWTVTFIMNYKIDHKESLLLARNHLNYKCKRAEVYCIYDMLRCLKTAFLSRERHLENTPSVSNIKLENDCLSSDTMTHELAQNPVDMRQQDLHDIIKAKEKRYSKLMTKLLKNQQNEKEEVQSKFKSEKERLEMKRRMEVAVINRHLRGTMKFDQLKSLEDTYREKFENLCSERDSCLKEHEKALERHKKKSAWIQGLKSWAKTDTIIKEMEKSQETNISQEKQVLCIPMVDVGEKQVKDVETNYCSDSHNAIEQSALPSRPVVSRNIKEVHCTQISPVAQDISRLKEGSIQQSCSTTSHALEVAMFSKVDNQTIVDVSVVGQSSVNKQHELLTLSESLTCDKPDNSTDSELADKHRIDGSRSQTLCSNVDTNIEIGAPLVDIEVVVDVTPCPAAIGELDSSLASVAQESAAGVDSATGLINLETVEEAENNVSIICKNVILEGERGVSVCSFQCSKSDVEYVQPNSKVTHSSIPSPSSIVVHDDPDDQTCEMIDGHMVISGLNQCNEPESTGDRTSEQVAVSSSAVVRSACEGGMADDLPIRYSCADKEPDMDSSQVITMVCVSSDGESNNKRVVDHSDLSTCVTEGLSEGLQHHSGCDGLHTQPDVRSSNIVELPSTLPEPESNTWMQIDTPTLLTGDDNRMSPSRNLQSTGDIEDAPVNAVSTNALCNLSEPNSVLQESDINMTTVEDVSPLPTGDATLVTEIHEVQTISDQTRQLPLTGPLSVQNVSNAECSGLSSQDVIQANDQPRQEVRDHNSSLELPAQCQVSTSHARTTPTPVTTETNNLTFPTVTATRMTVHPDPLQKELDFINREKETTMKVFEDIKLQLKSECDKEIEEESLKIRRKYESKLSQAEAISSLKKKELDGHCQKILMHMAIAEAFTFKLASIRTPTPPREMNPHYSARMTNNPLYWHPALREPIASMDGVVSYPLHIGDLQPANRMQPRPFISSNSVPNFQETLNPQIPATSSSGLPDYPPNIAPLPRPTASHSIAPNTITTDLEMRTNAKASDRLPPPPAPSHPPSSMASDPPIISSTTVAPKSKAPVGDIVYLSDDD